MISFTSRQKFQTFNGKFIRKLNYYKNYLSQFFACDYTSIVKVKIYKCPGILYFYFKKRKNMTFLSSLTFYLYFYDYFTNEQCIFPSYIGVIRCDFLILPHDISYYYSYYQAKIAKEKAAFIKTMIYYKNNNAMQ
jgi:hypothetical protein